jgi:hypothetical protein
MKDIKTIALDAASARGLIEEAKSVLSPLGRPKGKGLSSGEAQKAWFLLDKAEAYLDGLISYVAIGPPDRSQ